MAQYFIYQHMGLGDHFVCNGAVRSIIEQRGRKHQYFLFVKPHNHSTVLQMYKDLDCLHLLTGDDFYARNFITTNNLSMNSVVLIGHIDWAYKDKSFEENFYIQNSIPFQNKWLSFGCPRNTGGEQRVYDHYNIQGDYIFVHDDSRFSVDSSRLPKDVRIIRPTQGLTDSIIDYALVIERAKEVHCIESSFGFMVDLMNLNKNFTVHRYARGISELEMPMYKNAKEILK